MPFKKAERAKSKLRLALLGPSGSGKTYSAFRLAKGIGGKIAVIDTENGSASLYATEFDFDVMTLASPFTPNRYIQAIEEAYRARYDTVIIDSLSHAWNASGGVLDSVSRLNSSSANSGWRQMGPEQNRLLETIVQSPINVIVTMRVKTEYSYEKDETTGKVIPKKLGLAPIQKNDLEYEFTLVFDISQNDHHALTSKNRTTLFRDNVPFLITEETGKQLNEWLNTGKDELLEQVEKIKACKDVDELAELWKTVDVRNPQVEAAKDEMKAIFADVITNNKED